LEGGYTIYAVPGWKHGQNEKAVGYLAIADNNKKF
jgi:hypothetical protein